MTEWDNFGKDVEITISFNELMNILKVYDEAKVKNIIPCQIDDELYYPSLTWACFSLLWKSKIKEVEIGNQKLKKETDDVFNKIFKSLGSSDDPEVKKLLSEAQSLMRDLPVCEELKSCMDSLSDETREEIK